MRFNVRSVINSAKDHSGTLCAVGAIVGLAVTAYLSSKAAVKTYTDLDPDTDKKLKVKVYTKNYMKTAVAFAVTTGLIIGSDRSHVRKEVALAGVAALWRGKYADIHKAVYDKYGEEVSRELDEEIAKNHMKENPYTGSAPDISKGERLVYEPYTDQYFKVTEEKLRDVFYEANKIFVRDLELSLNFIIRELGGDTTRIDDKFGWYYDSETQTEAWLFYGTTWIEPINTVYMSADSVNKKSGPLKYLKYNEQPTQHDIRCLFYDVEPQMPFDEDMMYKEET